MLDEEFCDSLEYWLCTAFEDSDNGIVKGFWCDGVMLPLFEKDYSKKTVNDTRQVVTTAYIGKTGQEEYTMTIKFGNNALSRYARDLDITKCLSDPEKNDCFSIDTDKRRIEIQL